MTVEEVSVGFCWVVVLSSVNKFGWAAVEEWKNGRMEESKESADSTIRKDVADWGC